MDTVNNTAKNEYNEFFCSSCGARLIVTSVDIITDCPYCGSRQIMKEKLQGEFKPNGILPFKIDKNEFVSLYTSFVRRKLFAPNKIKNNPKIKEAKGIYVPYRLYKYDLETYARGEASLDGPEGIKKYVYFEKEYYMSFMVPQDASIHFNDNIMTSLEPFNFNQLEKFTPVYLNGFKAEKGNEDNEMLEMKAEERCLKLSSDKMKNELNTTFFNGKLEYSFRKIEENLIFLPVWFVETWHGNKKYSYAVNGQTGKIVGEIPISKFKLGVLMGILAILTTIFSIKIVNSFPGVEVKNYIGAIILIIALECISAYLLTKAYYKNVGNSISNKIKVLNIIDKVNNRYSKKEYIDKFSEGELKTFELKIFKDGKKQEIIHGRDEI